MPGDEAPPRLQAFRAELRAFLRAEIDRGAFDPLAGSWARPDPDFSRRLGARGWLGLDWPAELGGQGQGGAERRAVAEELLAHGAPVRAHWVAERVAGPAILRLGTPVQQAELLPRIAAGRLHICLGPAPAPGVADPPLATPGPGGWRLNGSLGPVADAATAHRLLLPARLPGGEDSLFILDLALPGLVLRPVPGLPDCAAVTVDDVFLADDRQLPGALPASAEPDLWLVQHHLLEGLAARVPPAGMGGLGRLVAGAWGLRALGRAGYPAAVLGLAAGAQAARVPDAARRLLPGALRVGDAFGEALARALLPAAAPTGGPGPAAVLQARVPPRPRPAVPPPRPAPLADRAALILAEAPLADARAELAAGHLPQGLWQVLEAAEVTRAALSRRWGGGGLSLAALRPLFALAGRHAAPVPLMDVLLAQVALQAARLAPPLGLPTMGPALPGEVAGFAGGRLRGRLGGIPWARHAAAMLVLAATPAGPRWVLAGQPAVVAEAANLAGEPRDTVELGEMPVLAVAAPGRGLDAAGLGRLGTLGRLHAMVGALDHVAEAVAHRPEGPPGAAVPRLPGARAAIGRFGAALAEAQAAAHPAAGAADSPFALGCAQLVIGAATTRILALLPEVLGAGVGPLDPWIRRLLAWREECGAEQPLAAGLGMAAQAAGPAGLWPLLADGGRMAPPGTAGGETPDE